MKDANRYTLTLDRSFKLRTVLPAIVAAPSIQMYLRQRQVLFLEIQPPTITPL